VTGPSGQRQAVLGRAVEPVIGMDLMDGRRKAKKLGKNLTYGPGKLCQAFGITREQNERDLTGACLYIAHSDTVCAGDIVHTTRINID
ncbi:DNA-3-methyladenine glycosylase, partial [Megasphaera massiliensis]